LCNVVSEHLSLIPIVVEDIKSLGPFFPIAPLLSTSMAAYHPGFFDKATINTVIFIITNLEASAQLSIFALRDWSAFCLACEVVIVNGADMIPSHLNLNTHQKSAKPLLSHEQRRLKLKRPIQARTGSTITKTLEALWSVDQCRRIVSIISFQTSMNC
jgi:hypothetical protein